MAEKLVVVPNTGLIDTRGRPIAVRGWHRDVAIAHLQWHVGLSLSAQWCEVGCMANAMFNRNTEYNRMQVRKHISKLMAHLLSNGVFLCIEYENHGRAKAAKIFQNDASEIAFALRQIDRMRQRRLISQEQLERALVLVGKKD